MLASQPKPFKIAIVGGGLGGLALAVGLRRRNVPFHIYEAAPKFDEIGAGVAFASNTVRALKLINPDLEAGVERCATHSSSSDNPDVWLRYMYGVNSRNGNRRKAGDHMFDIKAPGFGQLFVHRARFLDELVRLLPQSSASFRKSLKHIEEVDCGVGLNFGDGTEVKADAVVGCDGIRSRVREILLGTDNTKSYPTFADAYAYRGLAPMDLAKNVLGEHAVNGHLWMCYNKYCITYPVDGGRFLNMVAITSTGTGWEGSEWRMRTTHEEMMKDFADVGDTLRKLIDRIAKPTRWALFDMPPIPTYHRQGRIVLLGDSAHAATPHQGNGAGMAMEDACVLSHLIGKAQRAEDLKSAFAAYQSVRKPRVEKLVATSRETGLIDMFKHESIGDDPVKAAENMQERYKWIWNLDIENHVRCAEKNIDERM